MKISLLRGRVNTSCLDSGILLCLEPYGPGLSYVPESSSIPRKIYIIFEAGQKDCNGNSVKHSSDINTSLFLWGAFVSAALIRYSAFRLSGSPSHIGCPSARKSPLS